MGGAERSARKRRQQKAAGARAVSRARGGGGANRKIIVAVVAVVVLAAVVIGGVILTNSTKNNTAGQTIGAQTAAAGLDSPTERQGATVVSGSANAKVKLTVYEDFLCPICGELQSAYGTQLEQQIQAGTVQVTYRMIPLLNNSSDPPGYSLLSANAALCAADEGKFTAFHDSLYKSQPKEGGRGYDNAQLIKLGTDLGITSPAFTTCVNNGTYNAQINADFQQISANPTFEGTPTILHNGQSIDWSDPNWLTNLVNAP